MSCRKRLIFLYILFINLYVSGIFSAHFVRLAAGGLRVLSFTIRGSYYHTSVRLAFGGFSANLRDLS